MTGITHIIRLHPQPVPVRPRFSHSMSQSGIITRSTTPTSTSVPLSMSAISSTTASAPVASSQSAPGATVHPGSSTLIRTLTTLLSRSHFTTPLRPLLSLTLASISDHLTDTDLAPVPDIMMRMHELSPTSLDWLANWRSLLGVVYVYDAGHSTQAKEDVKRRGLASAQHDLNWMEEAVAARESDQWAGHSGDWGKRAGVEGTDEEETERCAGLIGLGGQLSRRKTREEVMGVLDRMYDSVRDMGTYRRALADVVCEFATTIVWWGVDATSLAGGTMQAGAAGVMGIGGLEARDEFEVVWRLLADEVVLRTVEGFPIKDIEPFLDLILNVAGDGGAGNVSPESKSLVSVLLGGGVEGAAAGGTPVASGTTSPVISRMQSEYAGTGIGTGTIVMPSASVAGSAKDGSNGVAKDNATSGSGLISLLSSFAAGEFSPRLLFSSRLIWEPTLGTTSTSNSSSSPGTGSSADESSASSNVTNTTTSATSANSNAQTDSSARPVSSSPQPILSPEAIYTARSLCGVYALISIFGQLAFLPFVMDLEGVRIAIKVYEALISIAGCELSHSLRDRMYIT